MVRSVTDTSIMFMMPIPPTNREIAAMPANKRVRVFMMVAIMSKMPCWLVMVKTSLRPSKMPVSATRNSSPTKPTSLPTAKYTSTVLTRVPASTRSDTL
ncbi:MAG: hypothetical protein DDT36_00861 [Firmicutes bacterium]|nr:hypothetical protein [Bacillota bacterium]